MNRKEKQLKTDDFQPKNIKIRVEDCSEEEFKEFKTLAAKCNKVKNYTADRYGGSKSLYLHNDSNNKRIKSQVKDDEGLNNLDLPAVG